MAGYKNFNIDWLLKMYSDGYYAICDADNKEVIDMVYE